MTKQILTYLAVLVFLGQLTSPLQAQELPADSLLALADELTDKGVTLYQEGRHTEAEPLYLRALAIRESALGPDHPDVATALSTLGVLYHNMGRYTEAEPLYQRALAIHRAPHVDACSFRERPSHRRSSVRTLLFFQSKS